MYHVSCIMYHVSRIMYHVSCIMYHVSCIMYHVSCIMYYVSCIMYHVSCIMYHVSCIMNHVSCIMYHVSCIMHHESCPRSKSRLKSSSEEENGEADAEEEDLVNLLKGSFNEQTWTMTSSELNRIKQDLLHVGPRSKPRLKSSSEDENDAEEDLLNLLNFNKIR